MIEFLKVTDDELIRKVASLAKEIWQEHFSGIISSAQIEYMLENFQSFNAIKKQIQNENYEYHLINDGSNIGYFAVVIKKSEVFLSKIYVLKGSRGKGYSKKVLEFIKQIRKPIILTVNKNNTDTIEIYKKLNFKIFDEVNNDIGNGFFMNDYVMRLEVQNEH